VAVWCRTRERLALAVLAFLVCGACAVTIGFRSAAAVDRAKAMFGTRPATTAPSVALPLAGLHSRTVVNRNGLAAMAMMILPVAVAIAGSRFGGSGLRLPMHIVGMLSAIWTLAVVVIMQSRSVWLAAVCLAWVMTRRFLKPAAWWSVAAALVLVVPAATYALWGDHPRFAELLASVQTRMEIWGHGFEALRSSPWTGIGFDFFRHSGYSTVPVWPNLLVGRPHAHNMLLQTALDVGLVGLVAYVAVTAFVLRRAYDMAATRGGDRWVRAVGIAGGLSLLSVHIYGLLDAVALGAKVGIFQWLACGLVLAAWRLQKPDAKVV
jgi:putative inorganic carbon (HCO3(-)) transporter